METTRTYPPIELLLKQAPNGIVLSQVLRAILTARYLKGAGAYATERLDPSGLPINACMEKDSMQDVIEETTDTIFNLLVECLKQGGNLAADSNLAGCLAIAIDLWRRAWVLKDNFEMRGV